MRLLTLAVAISALAAPILACGPGARPPRAADTPPAAEPPALRRVILANPSSGAAAPFFVAQDVGTFVRHGLDVEITPLNGVKSLQALAARQADYGILASRTVVDVDLTGGDLVMLAGITPTLAFAVYGRSHVGAVADLAGKSVGVSYAGSGADFAVRQALRRYGMEADQDYTLIYTGGAAKSLTALEQHKIHAAVFSPPNTARARKAGLREVLDISGLGIDYVIGALVSTRGFLAAEPDVNRRFLKGMLEGIYYAKTNPTATKQIMARYLETGDEELLEEAYTNFVERLLPRLPLVSLHSVELVLDELTGPGPRPVGPEAFVDNAPLVELENSGFVRKLWGE